MLVFGVGVSVCGRIRKQWTRHLTNWFYSTDQAAACSSLLFINPLPEVSGVLMTTTHIPTHLPTYTLATRKEFSLHIHRQWQHKGIARMSCKIKKVSSLQFFRRSFQPYEHRHVYMNRIHIYTHTYLVENLKKRSMKGLRPFGFVEERRAKVKHGSCNQVTCNSTTSSR